MFTLEGGGATAENKIQAGPGGNSTRNNAIDP